MNNSGPPVYKLAKYYGISNKDIIVIHDDIDLSLGRLKIKEKGGHGGHKGVRSLIDIFGSGDFARVRIGIGRGVECYNGCYNSGIDVSGHVLGKFSSGEKKNIDKIIKAARESVAAILCQGIKKGMNRFNSKKAIFLC